MRYFFLVLLSGLLAYSCTDATEKLKQMEDFEGPMLELYNIRTLYSDSMVVRMIMNAATQLEFESGDREFPDGILIEFLEADGSISSTLTANVAYYYKETNLYKAVGDVEVKGYETNEKLNTEELWWDPRKEEVFTDKFVRIESEGEILTGEGLKAKQDFSEYEILKPLGSFYIDDTN